MRVVPSTLPKLFGAHAIAVHTELILCVPARAPHGTDEDPALWEHEREHCRQQADHFLGAFGWWLHYLASSKYRLACEVAAYQEQLTHYEGTAWVDRLHAFADILASGYFLGITREEARALLEAS